MTQLARAVASVLAAQRPTDKPLAVVLAGHNGSGKSTMWRERLSPQLQIPLVNADRMMLSILPEPGGGGALEPWARSLRDTDTGWMKVAQDGVQAFVGHAMRAKVPFAMETMFSHWEPRPDGSVESKIDLIRNMQKADYFVLLCFVGLSDVGISILHVQSRVSQHGHDVPLDRLVRRFPKTQRAIAEALKVADASILVDNSRTPREAFTVARVQLGRQPIFDVRDGGKPVPPLIARWLEKVSPVSGLETA